MIVRTRRQHRVPTELQRSLCRSDPPLVARFALFTRLTMDEDIPLFERVRGWAGRGRSWWSGVVGAPPAMVTLASVSLACCSSRRP
jgi:hypothetical protein